MIKTRIYFVREGFSLVELMVVVTIIVILLGILLPSLAGAKRKARMAAWLTYTKSLSEDPAAIFHYFFMDDKKSRRLVNKAMGGVSGGDLASRGPTLDGKIQGKGEWLDQGRWNKPALNFEGTDTYVKIRRDLVDRVTEFTFMTWINWRGGGAWQRIFDFGQDTNYYMVVTPLSGSNTLRFIITNAGGGAEQQVNAPPLVVNRWTQVAVTLSPAGGGPGAQKGILYVDGQEVASNANISLKPGQLYPINNYLGEGQFPADPLLNGMMDEAVLLARGLKPAEVKAHYDAGKP